MQPGHWTPIGPHLLADTIVRRLLHVHRDTLSRGVVRVIVDGPRCAHTGPIADDLVEPLRAAGHPVIRASSASFLRDASLRLEYGHQDVESYYSGWVDLAALRRELLAPAETAGRATVITSLRDPVTNRSTRTQPIAVGPGSVVILDGEMLLGAGLPAEFVVHISVSPAARRRHTDPQWAWTLPALHRYDAEVDPAGLADLVVRADDPRHLAVTVR